MQNALPRFIKTILILLFLFYLEASDVIYFGFKGLGKLKIVNFNEHLPVHDFW